MTWRDIWPENPSDEFGDDWLDEFSRQMDNNFNGGKIRLFGQPRETDWDEELKRLLEEK